MYNLLTYSVCTLMQSTHMCTGTPSYRCVYEYWMDLAQCACGNQRTITGVLLVCCLVCNKVSPVYQ